MKREMKAGVCVRVELSHEARRITTLHELEPGQDALPATISGRKFERFSVWHKRSSDAPFGSCAAALRDEENDSFASQRNHRVNFRRPTRRYKTCAQRRKHQRDEGGGEDQRVAGTDLVKQVAHHLLDIYSCCNAAIGSTFAARRAGI